MNRMMPNVPIIGQQKTVDTAIANAKPLSEAECAEIHVACRMLAQQASGNGQPIETVGIPMPAPVLLRMDAFIRKSRQILGKLVAVPVEAIEAAAAQSEALSALSTLQADAKALLEAPVPGFQMNTNENLNKAHAEAAAKLAAEKK